MKLVERDVWKILPGKMAEALELEKRELAALNRLGVDISVKHYRPLTGAIDQKHTIVAESELGSFASIAAFGEKIGADPEMQEIQVKWEEISESQVLELYMVND
jgi:hypothetical protein